MTPRCMLQTSALTLRLTCYAAPDCASGVQNLCSSVRRLGRAACRLAMVAGTCDVYQSVLVEGLAEAGTNSPIATCISSAAVLY